MSKPKNFKAAVKEAENPADTFLPPQEAPANAQNKKYSEILDNIKEDSGSQGGNITLYLDGELIKAINATSKEKGLSRSKLVSKILRQVLLED
jgi:hypothetical protein